MKRVLVTGGTGFIGRKLIEGLAARGDQVTVLTRNPERVAGDLPGTVRAKGWDPAREGPWFAELEGVDAVVHLAGENVAQRWTAEARRRIEQSRIESTRLLVEAIGKAQERPATLVCASAIGYYGPQPPEVSLDESAPAGTGFLAEVCQRWEAAAITAERLSVRVVRLRIGVVLGEGGGALEKMALPFKLFVGGKVASGRQIISWVHRDDVVGLLLLALDRPTVSGPLNAVAPNPASSAELAQALGKILRRPAWLPVPSFALELAMGEASAILTTGQRVLPRRALELGYSFQWPDLLPALGSIFKAKDLAG